METGQVRVLLLLALLGMALRTASIEPPNSQLDFQSTPGGPPKDLQGAAASLAPAPLNGVSTGGVECDRKRLTSRSADLISPKGILASVEINGEILEGKTPNDNRCRTTWTLHLVSHNLNQTVVVDSREDEPYNENTFQMNGWSRDGRFLLLSEIRAAGDWDETTPIVYDAEKRQLWRIELTPLFKDLTKENCPIYFRPLGFASEGKVLLDVGSLNASDLDPGEKPYFESSRWELDYVQKQVHQVSDSAAADKFGIESGERTPPTQD
jgi:hypothetical protein